MPETAKTLVNTVKIKKAIEAEVPLLITTYTLPHEMELYIHDVITEKEDSLISNGNPVTYGAADDSKILF